MNMTKQDVIDGFYRLLLDGDADILDYILDVRDLEEMGVISLHGGLKIIMKDGSEYGLPFMKSE